MMLFCKAVFIKLLLSRSNRQAPIRDTGQIGFLYSAEVFCKKLGLAMEIMSLKSQSVPCGELIEGGDEDNPLSEQQPWLNIAKYLPRTTAIYFPSLPPRSWKTLVHPFPFNRKALLRFSNSLSAKENAAPQTHMQCENCLEHTSTDVHLSAWHLAHRQGGTPVSVGHRCQLNTNLE